MIPRIIEGFQREEHVADVSQWYWDPSTSYFWTWDTPQFIAPKFSGIVKARGLGGVSKSDQFADDTRTETDSSFLVAWSLGEDSADYTYIRAIQSGLASLSDLPGQTSVVPPTYTTDLPTTSSSSSGTVPQWGQCGGQGYTGPTACVSRYTCTCSGVYWCDCR